MKENICTSCGASIPEGLQVCGVCLKKNEGPEYHQAVRKLERYCKDFSSKHKSCDECPLRHHCQNTISSWPRLMLVTDLADYEEPVKSKQITVERVEKATNKWLNKNWMKVYLAIVILVCLLVFLFGFIAGHIVGELTDKTESNEVAVVNQHETKMNFEPDWYIDERSDPS